MFGDHHERGGAMANHLTEGLAGAPEAIGKAVTKVNDCSSGLRRAVEATFIAGAEDTHHLLEGVGHGAQDGMGKSAEAKLEHHGCQGGEAPG